MTGNPRLSEATEEQLKAQLAQLDQRTDYDRMMSRLLEYNRECDDAEWRDVKQLKVDLQELFDTARVTAAAKIHGCPACDKEPGEPCGDDPKDTHLARTMGIKDEDVEAMARKLRPDLITKAEEYQKMIDDETRGRR